jgi:hypothetical protein
MKLNPDCIRDILLYCEENSFFGNSVVFQNEDFTYKNNVYSHAELLYHLRQCDMNNYFLEGSYSQSGKYILTDITPKAHEFLANIRSDSVWGKTKTVAKEIGAFSLNSLADIASKIITNIILAHLN